MPSQNTSYLLPIISKDFHTAKKFIVDLFETQFVIDVLLKYGGKVSFAAKHAGLSTEDLLSLIAKHKIDVKQFSSLQHKDK